MKKFKKFSEIEKIVANFENCTIAREQWRHAEHLTVALFYISDGVYELAYQKMRGGIFKLLKSFSVDLTKEMPYHETLTVFWLKTVETFAAEHKFAPRLELHNRLIEEFGSDFPLRFYTRDYLFSESARSKYLPPDLV